MNELNVMTYNICNYYPKSYEGTPVAQNWIWNNRKDRIFQIVKNALPDFACFQEVQDFFVGGQRQRMMTDFYNSLGNNYDFTYANNSPYALSLVNVIAYKIDKYLLAQTYRWWNNPNDPDQFGDHPKGNGAGRTTLMAKFYPLTKNEKGMIIPDYKADPIYVVNLHPGMQHAEKMSHHSIILNKIAQIVQSGHVFVCGDFNCFPDDKGDEELALYDQAGFVDASKDLKTLEGIDLTGTMVGYSFDNFKSPLGKVGAQLDHIFYKWIDPTKKMKAKFIARSDLNNYIDANKKEMKSISDYLVGPQGEDLRDKLPSDHSSIIVKACIVEEQK